MLKFENVNNNIKKIIKANYSRDELRTVLENELGYFNNFPTEEELSEGAYVDAPHFLINHDETNVWLVCKDPSNHYHGIYDDTDVVEFEHKNEHKDLETIAKELDVDYDELKEYYSATVEDEDDMDAFSELNDLIMSSSTTAEMRYGKTENTIVLSE